MIKVTLHLGLHKTGTTFLQNTLLENKSRLEDFFSYVPMKHLRNNITPSLSSNNDFKRNKALKFLSKIESTAVESIHKKVVISEENFLGYPYQIKEGLYKDSLKRLESLKKLIDATDAMVVTKVVVTLREYSEFFQSMFIEANRREFIHLNSINKDYLIDFSFLELIDNIKTVFPASELDIVDFEKFKKNNFILFSSVTGVDDQQLYNSLKHSSEKRVSPSIKAYYDSMRIFEVNDLEVKVKNLIHYTLMSSNLYSGKIQGNILFAHSECENLKRRYKQEIRSLEKP